MSLFDRVVTESRSFKGFRRKIDALIKKGEDPSDHISQARVAHAFNRGEKRYEPHAWEKTSGSGAASKALRRKKQQDQRRGAPDKGAPKRGEGAERLRSKHRGMKMTFGTWRKV